MGPQHSFVDTWLPCKCHRELCVGGCSQGLCMGQAVLPEVC